MIKRFMFPLLFLVLAYFVLSYESAKEIIAGIAIFLVGMFFMEDGFKLFSGGFLEKILEKFTNSMPKAILNGFLISSIVQSSSLTSVILISFFSTNDNMFCNIVFDFFWKSASAQVSICWM